MSILSSHHHTAATTTTTTTTDFQIIDLPKAPPEKKGGSKAMAKLRARRAGAEDGSPTSRKPKAVGDSGDGAGFSSGDFGFAEGGDGGDSGANNNNSEDPASNGGDPDAQEDSLLRQAEVAGEVRVPTSDRRDGGLTWKLNGDADSYTLQPQQVRTVEFSFTPYPSLQTPGHFIRPMRMTFTNSNTEYIDFDLNALIQDVPIYVEHSLMDLKCCVLDKLYRTKLILRNRGKVGLKVSLSVPKQLRNAVEFNPNLGFVQGSDKHGEPGRFEVCVKFRPSAGLLEQCGKWALPHLGVLAVPVHVTVPDQVLPVFFTLRALLTTSDIAVTPPKIEFGPSLTTQTVTVPIELHNRSLLPQKFGFLNVPTYVDIQPGDGFGILLPGEKTVLDVHFSPNSATDHNFSLQMRTSFNRTFSIPCVGRGVVSPLRLSHSVVKFAATAPGALQDQSVFITNLSKIPQTVEWALPDQALTQLTVSPAILTVNAGATIRSEFVFTPRQQDVAAKTAPDSNNPEVAAPTDSGDPADGTAETTDPALNGETVDGAGEGVAPTDEAGAGAEGGPLPESGDGAGDTEEGDENVPDNEGTVDKSDIIGRAEVKPVKGLKNPPASIPGNEAILPEELSHHATWKVPLFVKDSTSPLIYVEVQTTSVAPILTTNSDRLDFKEIAVGEVAVLQLKIKNLDDELAPLMTSGLNPHSPFSIVNALRPVAPGGTRQLLVQFAPQGQRHYLETLVLKSPKAQLYITLIGEGVSPSLAIEPENGFVDMGHCLAGNVVKKTVKIRNSSMFPLLYNIRPKQMLHSNFNCIQSTSCEPSEATIPNNGEQEVTVIFTPDHERPKPYIAEFKVEVANQSEDHELRVSGRCWDRQVYVVPTDKRDEPNPASVEAIEDLLALPAANSQAPTRCICLTFPKTKKQPSTAPANDSTEEGGGEETPAKDPSTEKPAPVAVEKSIEIGNMKIEDEKAGSAGSFEVQFVTTGENGPNCKYFKVDQEKGSATPGSIVPVKFTFTPPEVLGGSGSMNIGQWVEAMAKCTVKGGYVPSGHSDTNTVDIKLRGYIEL
jgi:hypothetical protein